MNYKDPLFSTQRLCLSDLSGYQFSMGKFLAPGTFLCTKIMQMLACVKLIPHSEDLKLAFLSRAILAWFHLENLSTSNPPYPIFYVGMSV